MSDVMNLFRYFLFSFFLFYSGTYVSAQKKHEFSRPLMGMTFRIVIYSENSSLASKGAKSAFDKVAILNKIMSDYDSTSELSRLSNLAGSGKAARISDSLFQVLQAGQLLGGRTDGAFDVTSGASTRLWRQARRLKRVPPEDAIKIANNSSGYRYLKLDKFLKTAELLKDGMRLDLGGIAKGFALDEAFKLLISKGFSKVLVSAGGDILVGEPPPGKQGWKIALLGLGDSVTEYIFLKNCAVATSGDLFQFLEFGGKRYSHIIDPRTGAAISEQRLVHVLAPKAMQADSLATAISVIGQKDGLRLVAGDKRLAARIAFRNKSGQVKKKSNQAFKAWPRVDE